MILAEVLLKLSPVFTIRSVVSTDAMAISLCGMEIIPVVVINTIYAICSVSIMIDGKKNIALTSIAHVHLTA